MRGQVRAGREALAAVAAAEGPLARVSSQMFVQRAGQAEAATAQRALVTLLTRVSQQVLAHVHHRLATHLTRRPPHTYTSKNIS